MNPLVRFSALAVFLLVLSSPARSQTWNLQTVDDAGDTGYDSQIVVTPSGVPFIFYKSNTSNTLNLAYWVGTPEEGGWQYRQLDTYISPGYTYEAIADSLGRIHVVWNRYATPYTKYGIFDPTTLTWVLGPEGVTGTSSTAYLDLALVHIGGNIIPVIGYSREGNYVYIYRRDPGTGAWSYTQVDAVHTSSHAPTVAVDSAHNLHVAFYEETGDNLMYATKAWDDAVWQISTVDLTGNVGDYPSILVDSSDNVHIVYYDTTNGDLKYATLTH
jgi:hypothetical protein